MISRSLLRGLPIIGLALIACDPGGPTEPEAVQVPVSITTPKDIALVGPMRIAVVWRQASVTGQHWLSTYDAPLTTSVSSAEVTLSLPPKAVLPSLTDTNIAYMNCYENAVGAELPVVIPRIVVYQDLDDSGDFNPHLPEGQGIDRIWAVTPGSSTYLRIAAFADLDQSLSQLPMEMAECIESYTGGRYSAFFMGNDYSSYVSPAATKLFAQLYLSPTDSPTVDMGCSYTSASNIYSGDTRTYSGQSTTIDSHVAASTCSSAPWQCTQDDISSTTLPDFVPWTTWYPGYSRNAYCTTVGTLDVLWAITDVVQCDGCDCTWIENDESWIVDSTTAPANWPCGRWVEYCEGLRTTVWDVPTYCIPLDGARPE
jgi:hypothetical protein